MTENLKVVPMTPGNILDRLGICWGHLKDWKTLEIVQKSQEWLEKANASFTPTTFIAHMDKMPVGLIEFTPLRLMKTLGLIPCRRDLEKGEVESRYIPEEDYGNCLFISCLWVRKDCRGKGVGRSKSFGPSSQ